MGERRRWHNSGGGRGTVRRGVLVWALAAAGLAAVGPSAAPARAVAGSTRSISAPAAARTGTGFGAVLHMPVLFRRAWVRVPVATVWTHAATDRSEDAPAVSSSPDVARWLTGLTLDQKLGLDDLLSTQTLLDQPVIVYGHRPGWDHVLVLGQTGAVYPFGIAGWIPDRQLTYTSPPAGTSHVTVAVPELAVGGLELSYGTRLPVVAASPLAMTVELPGGRFPVPPASVRATPLAPSGDGVVNEARRFLSLPYLWAGTSAYGYDCSGLTFSVFRQFGITLPRDAADQAAHGAVVARGDLRPGDLVFFSFGGPVDHVGIYAGDGMMIDSPRTGASIELVSLWHGGLAPYYAGARRYI